MIVINDTALFFYIEKNQVILISKEYNSQKEKQR